MNLKFVFAISLMALGLSEAYALKEGLNSSPASAVKPDKKEKKKLLQAADTAHEEGIEYHHHKDDEKAKAAFKMAQIYYTQAGALEEAKRMGELAKNPARYDGNWDAFMSTVTEKDSEEAKED